MALPGDSVGEILRATFEGAELLPWSVFEDSYVPGEHVQPVRRGWLFCAEGAPVPSRLHRRVIDALEAGNGAWCSFVQFSGGAREFADCIEGDDRTTLWARNVATTLREFTLTCGGVPDEAEPWKAASRAARASAESGATIEANAQDQKRDWRKVLTIALGDRYNTRAIASREQAYQEVKAGALVRIRDMQNMLLERLLSNP